MRPIIAMLWMLWLYKLLFLFLVFERSQADELFDDGDVKISYNDHDLLITWKTLRDPGLKLHVQLLCGAAQIVGDELVNSSVGQVTFKILGPASCTVTSRDVPNRGNANNFNSPLFFIPADTSPPSDTPSTQPTVSTEAPSYSSSSSSPPSPSQNATSSSNSAYANPVSSSHTPIPSLLEVGTGSDSGSGAAPTPDALSVTPNPSTTTSSTNSYPANPSTSPSTSNQLAAGHPSKPIGAIIGGTVGGVLALCALAALVLLYLRRRRRRRNRLDQLCRLPFTRAYDSTSSEKQEWTDRVQHAMVEAKKQTGYVHSEIQLVETRHIHTPKSHHSDLTSIRSYETSDETDDNSGEKRATASQKGKSRAFEEPYDSPRSSLYYGSESDIDSRSDDESHHLGGNPDLRHHQKADSLYLAMSMGQSIAI